MSDHRSQGSWPERAESSAAGPSLWPHSASGRVDHHSQHSSSHASETCSAEQSSSPAPARPSAGASGSGRSVADRSARADRPADRAPAASSPHPPVAEETSTPRPQCRVVLADENPAERAGIVAALHVPPDVTVVAETVDAEQACDAAQLYAPDVVLLDVHTPSGDGVAALRRLVSLAPVLLLTYDRDSEITRQALCLGALGYLVHGCFTDEELVAAVRAVRDTRGATAEASGASTVATATRVGLPAHSLES
ncbi:response regulator transcription factor [Streptomyces sp. P38-E01]|uniref:Response regulator transcription factor n=1 Tax=Streptomyces tardus TaxID=2780544 RepID=A0A949N6N5_9ACTN|nr:response regulator transcription factor [Streptomyces tardus]MBU7596616.1 response regulator transcription factor [Streptomyces tardus]